MTSRLRARGSLARSGQVVPHRARSERAGLGEPFLVDELLLLGVQVSATNEERMSDQAVSPSPGTKRKGRR